MSSRADFPEGDTKTDEFFGEQVVYHRDVTVRVPDTRAAREAFSLPLKVTYQGCAEAGLCYSPITKTFDVALPEADSASLGEVGKPAGEGFVSEQRRPRAADHQRQLLRDDRRVSSSPACCCPSPPCVLPMVPIVSGPHRRARGGS